MEVQKENAAVKECRRGTRAVSVCAASHLTLPAPHRPELADKKLLAAESHQTRRGMEPGCESQQVCSAHWALFSLHWLWAISSGQQRRGSASGTGRHGATWLSSHQRFSCSEPTVHHVPRSVNANSSLFFFGLAHSNC